MKGIVCFSVCLCCTLILGGCRREMDLPEIPDQFTTYSLRVHASPPMKGNLVDAESLEDPQWRIFRGGELLYSSEDAPEELVLSSRSTYQVFAWANHTVQDDSSPEALLSATHAFTSNSADWDGLKIPMALYLDGVNATELDRLDGEEDHRIHLCLVRLLALVEVEIAYDDLLQTMFPTETVGGRNYGIRLNSIQVGGLRQEVGLFSSSANVRGRSDGDRPLNQSTGSQSFSLYVPESLAGNLLPEGTPPEDKVIPSRASGYCYPYISLNFTFSSYLYREGDGHAREGGTFKTFRIYLGENNSNNFDVRRGYHYRLCLTLSYDALGVNGTWRIDGADRTGSRSLSLWTDNPVAAPGETVYFSYRYSHDNHTDTDYYLQRGNGFALGLETQREAYLSGGTLPAGFTRTDAGPMWICATCGHQYRMPSTGDRLAWVSGSVSTDERTAIHCRWCDTDWFSPASDEETAAFLAAVPGDDLGYARLENAPVQVAYTVPPDALPGSRINLEAWWRDGSLETSTSLQVGYEAHPQVSCTRPGTLWVGQANAVTVSSWSRLIFGDDPAFTFALEAGTPATLRRFTPDQARFCELAAARAGNYTLRLLFNGQEVASVAGTVRAPQLSASAGPYSVTPWGDDTAVPRPVLCREVDGVWTAYTRADGDVLSNGRHLWDDCLDLRYTLSADPFFDCTMDGNYAYVFLKNLCVGGQTLDVVGDCYAGRTVGWLSARSAACPDVNTVTQYLQMLPFLSRTGDQSITLYMDPTRPSYTDFTVHTGVQATRFYNGMLCIQTPDGSFLQPSAFPEAYGSLQGGASGTVDWHVDPARKNLPLGTYTLYLDAKGKEDAAATRFTVGRFGLSRYIYVPITGQKDYDGTDCYHFKMLIPAFSDGTYPMPASRFSLLTGQAYQETGDNYALFNRIWTVFDASVPAYTVYVDSKGSQYIQSNLGYVLSKKPLLDLLASGFSSNGVNWQYRNTDTADEGKLMTFVSSDGLQTMAVGLTYHDLAQGNISWGTGFD